MNDKQELHDYAFEVNTLDYAEESSAVNTNAVKIVITKDKKIAIKITVIQNPCLIPFS